MVEVRIYSPHDLIVHVCKLYKSIKGNEAPGDVRKTLGLMIYVQDITSDLSDYFRISPLETTKSILV